MTNFINCNARGCSPKYHKKCKFELCDTTNLHGGTWGYCGAHYRQYRVGGEGSLKPTRGSKYFWADHLNEKGEKQCSRCKYWLPIQEFHVRSDGSRVHKEFGRAHCRRCNILRRMSITARDYDEMWVAQGERCAVCGCKENSTEKRFSVDHDHTCCNYAGSCGRCIRGILCDSCNNLLSRARDKVDILLSAVRYLS